MTIIDMFQSYFLNEKSFGTRMKKTVEDYSKNGIVLNDREIEYNTSLGKTQDCELNSYKCAKTNNMLVVEGYVHNGPGNYWVNHFWVYDPEKHIHIEVTPDIKNSKGRIGKIVKREMLKISLGKWGTIPKSMFYKRDSIKEETIIEIVEEVIIEDIILEKGDRIKIIEDKDN